MSMVDELTISQILKSNTYCIVVCVWKKKDPILYNAKCAIANWISMDSPLLLLIFSMLLCVIVCFNKFPDLVVLQHCSRSQILKSWLRVVLHRKMCLKKRRTRIFTTQNVRLRIEFQWIFPLASIDHNSLLRRSTSWWVRGRTKIMSFKPIFP